MSKHTKEPWFVNEDGIIRVGKPNVNDYIDPIPIASAWREGAFSDGEETEESQDNARRIVACVNACAGLDTEALDSRFGIAAEMWGLADKRLARVQELVGQRDELLAALKGVVKVADRQTDEFNAARAAIAKAEAV
jgi:hypothetical protein